MYLRGPSIALLLLATAIASSPRRRPEKRQIETCTDYDCLNSYIDVFTSTADAFSNPVGFGDISSIFSDIGSSLSLLGITLTSPTGLLNPTDTAAIAGLTSTFTGPFVSDIVSSYSAHASRETAVGSSGGSLSTDGASETASAASTSFSSPLTTTAARTSTQTRSPATTLPFNGGDSGGVRTTTVPAPTSTSTARAGTLSVDVKAAWIAPLLAWILG